MENGEKAKHYDTLSNFMTLTANEVANVLGENYKAVVKHLKILATEQKINVTEKTVNNRTLDGYILSISDLQTIKDKLQKRKHFQNEENATNVQMIANAINTSNIDKSENDTSELANVKLYEEKSRNLELTREVEKLKAELNTKTNENVRLDADLTVAKSELKYITDKSSSMESAWAEEKQKTAQLEKVIKSKNIAIIVLGAILLVIIAVSMTLYLARII